MIGFKLLHIEYKKTAPLQGAVRIVVVDLI